MFHKMFGKICETSKFHNSLVQFSYIFTILFVFVFKSTFISGLDVTYYYFVRKERNCMKRFVYKRKEHWLEKNLPRSRCYKFRDCQTESKTRDWITRMFLIAKHVHAVHNLSRLACDDQLSLSETNEDSIYLMLRQDHWDETFYHAA